jgi:hypothetical protein
MRISILHLSDIHLRAGVDNAPLRRVEEIVKAVASVASGVESCIILLSGDIAFKGSEDDYSLARTWIATLKQHLKTALKAPYGDIECQLHIAACPGNHDCDFSGEQMIRELIIKEVGLKETLDAKDEQPLIEASTKVQDEFFKFLDDIQTSPRHPLSPSTDPRIGYEYKIELSNSIKVRITCLNTAWMSRLHEQPGTLKFPAKVIPDRHDSETLSLVTFHHPTNWLEPNNARLFRGQIERFADLIFTGHEHASRRSETIAEHDVEFTHLEGGVLQESSNPNISDFTTLIVDLDTTKLKHFRCTWNGELYEVRATRLRSGDDTEWQEFPLNLARRLDVVRLAPDWEEQLNDPGIRLTHPRLTKVRLADIFVYPDIREVELRKEMTRSPVRVIRGESVLTEVLRHSHVLITGDTQSGKTSLAKMLALQFFKRGDLPIVIDERNTRSLPKADRVEDFLVSTMFAQYRCANPDILRQVDRSKRVVIFDDSHRLAKLSRQAKAQFLDALCGSAGRIVLLAHDVSVGLDELLSPDAVVTFQRFRLLPFGQASRNTLVERWLTLGRESGLSMDTRELVRTLDELMQTINTLVGKNFVIPYPVYILSVLQAAEAAVNVDTKASTHGYFYELLIKASLARGSGKIPYDIVASYLSFLAFHMFKTRVFEMDRSSWQSVHREFIQSRDLDYDFDLFHGHLLNLEIIQLLGDVYRFKYQYFFYYFLASYMRDHIVRSDVRGHISAMSGSLHIEMHANVLLFLAHLSKDPVIITEMLNAARSHFSEHRPATLDKDVTFLSVFATELAEAKFLNVFRDGDTVENRRKALEAADQREQPDLIRETDRVVDGAATEEPLQSEHALDRDALDPPSLLNSALKTAQILGQIVKNFPGSLEGEQKAEIVRECSELILRALTWVMSLFRHNEERIIDEVMELLKDPSQPLSREELQTGAKAVVFGLVSLASYGLVKRASYAVGSTLLTRTYSRVFSDGTPAQALIDASLDLDHSGAFPVDKLKDLGGKFKKGQSFAHMLLRGLVIQHFHMFPVPYTTKQRVCAALDIRYESGEKVDPRAKMLKKAKLT